MNRRQQQGGASLFAAQSTLSARSSASARDNLDVRVGAIRPRSKWRLRLLPRSTRSNPDPQTAERRAAKPVAVRRPPILAGNPVLHARPQAQAAAAVARLRAAPAPVLQREPQLLPARAPLPAASTERPLPEQAEQPGSFFARLAALLIIAACAGAIFMMRADNVTYYWYRPLLNAYSIGVGLFILSRFIIALFYRPPRDVGLEPRVSVIVTAYNEEDAVYRTLQCCFAADYPQPKLEVIAVDDGSSDRTFEELKRAQRRWPELQVVRFDRNKGKREAMAAGARAAGGEVLLYVDSDSFMRRDAIRRIVQGFADPAVAAVAGHTEVANRDTNVLTRMQEVRYYVAFRIMKAAESVFGAVTCCPGCFSAYRRSCVMPILDRWLHQRFLGVPATFGDDRSLTNHLLRKYKVIYASNAIATTIVPDRHLRFLKQQLRWKKSWLRECLIASSFMWKKHPVAVLSFYAQLLFPIIAPLILLRALVWMPLIQQDPLSMLVYTFGVLMIGCIFSAYYLFWKASATWLYGAYFTMYYMLVLVWQMPYAILTSRDNRWGTR